MATAVEALPRPTVPISRVPYLPGLDGMRALAVVAVMVYHANSAWLPGGFLGVEVFFVISGYLITLLLIAEHERFEKVRLTHFWKRRARRLLPALFTMMGLVMVGCALFMRDELGKLRGDLIAGFAYSTNWYQIWTGAGYTAPVEFAPLRHLWSLAVEEQFYVVWPLVMLVLLRRGRDRLPRVGTWLFGASIAIAVATAFLFHPGTIGDCTSTPDQFAEVAGRCLQRTDILYLNTITRSTGILLGASFAMWWRPYALMRGGLRRKRTVIDLMGLCGLGVLAALVWNVHVLRDAADGLQGDPRLFRGGLLVTGLATVMVIAAVAHLRSRLGWVLGNPLFEWVGTRSYGLYLYHWPIYQFIRKHAGDALTVPELIVALAITGVVAEASYRFVEMPVRTGQLAAWVRRNLRGRPTRAAVVRRRRALAGSALALALPVFAGISLIFAPLRQNDVEQALAEGNEHTVSLAELANDGFTTSTSSTTSTSTSIADADSTTSSAVAVSPVDPAADIPADPANTAPAGVPTETAPPDTTPPTEPPTTTVPAGPTIDVLAIGDSVMEGAAPSLAERGAQVDALKNRNGKPWGIDYMTQLKDYGVHVNWLVIHLGTNGSMSQNTWDTMLQLATNVDHILVLTVRADRGWTAGNNEVIRALPGVYPNVQLLDWENLSQFCAGDCFYSDGIHLPPTGRRFYADLVWFAIGRGPDPLAATPPPDTG